MIRESGDVVRRLDRQSIFRAQRHFEEVKGAEDSYLIRFAGKLPTFRRSVIARVVDASSLIVVVGDPQVGPNAIFTADVDRGLHGIGLVTSTEEVVQSALLLG